MSLTLPFDIFTDALEGFGFTGGAGYTETRIENANGDIDVIPGYSDWVANGTVYYDLGGFNARTSVRYRSGFLGDFTGFGGSPTRRLARSETIVDAQIGYTFEGGSLDGLSVFLNGSNLTNAPFVAQANAENEFLVLDYQEYGRRFQVGATFRF